MGAPHLAGIPGERRAVIDAGRAFERHDEALRLIARIDLAFEEMGEEQVEARIPRIAVRAAIERIVEAQIVIMHIVCAANEELRLVGDVVDALRQSRYTCSRRGRGPIPRRRRQAVCC